MLGLFCKDPVLRRPKLYLNDGKFVLVYCITILLHALEKFWNILLCAQSDHIYNYLISRF